LEAQDSRLSSSACAECEASLHEKIITARVKNPDVLNKHAMKSVTATIEIIKPVINCFLQWDLQTISFLQPFEKIFL
jgi:hypothetical protein